MKICHIAPHLGAGGSEYLTFHLALQQRHAGHDVAIALLTETAADSPDRPLVDKREAVLRSEGIPFRTIGTVARNPLPAGLELRRMWKSPTTGSPDIVHCHNVVSLASAAIGSVTTPRVLTLHNTKLNFPARGLSILSHFAREVVGVADAVAEKYGPHSRRRILVVENGVDLPAPGPRTHPHDQTRASIVAVGDLIPQKNYPRMIQAFAMADHELAGREVDARLRIVGTGPEHGQLVDLIGELTMSEKIELLGARDDVPELMRDADLFVMSSDHEGLPISMLEALAAGLPVVCTPFPSSREVLVGELSTGISREFDSRALAERIVYALTDSDRIERLSNAASARAEEYSIQKCAAAYEKIYRQVLRVG